MPDTGNAKDCLELPPTNFSIFTLKNVTWRTYLISFTVQYCFLFRFVCIELVSLIWVLQIWVAIYVYGTMINWSTLIKKLMQTYIVIVSGSILNVSTVHLNGIWHLIWRYLLKPVLGRHPVLSGHYSISQGCPFKVARYSFSGSIPSEFEHKVCRHKQRFGKMATTAVLDKDENLLWSGLQCHWSCHSNKMTLLPNLLAAVFLALATVLLKSFTRAFPSNSRLNIC